MKSDLRTEAVERFEGNLARVTDIQKEFFDEADEFCLYRKGEFDNIVEISRYIGQFVAENKAWLLPCAFLAVNTAVNVIRLVRDRRDKGPAQGKGIKPRPPSKALAVVSASTPMNQSHLKELARLGAVVHLIAEKNRGRMRFFVNEKRYCLFFRQQKDDFWGYIGSDAQTIDRLVCMFSQDCGGEAT